MKTALYGVALAALLSAAGCIPQSPFAWPDAKDVPPEQVLPRKHVPAVRADQVTPENARQITGTLEEELEQDADAPPR